MVACLLLLLLLFVSAVNFVSFFSYYNNDKANKDNWTSDGWFRTGDEGYLDQQYLTLTGKYSAINVVVIVAALGNETIIGRIKELINRGGEKISPLEIDAVLLQHKVYYTPLEISLK